MIVMHSCQCEKPVAGYGRFGRFGRAFREDAALVPPSEETIDAMESFEVPSPQMAALDAAGFKTVVKTAVVFWAVTRILDHVFLGKGQ